MNKSNNNHNKNTMEVIIMKSEIMNELVNDIKNLNHCHAIGDDFSVFLRILDRMDYFFNELSKITGVRHYVEYNEKLGEFEIK